MEALVPYQYVYGIGGLVFGLGLLVAWRRGALEGNRGWLKLLGFGFLAYAGAHLALQLYGEPGPMPPTGGARGAEGLVGSTTDLVVVAVYFLAIVGLGAYFARFTRTSSDFFFGGRRFSAWLIAISCVATTVGSYSFLKYSSAGFRFGFSSSMSYLNDWFWMPLWMLVWLPIICYGRLQSVPEYFERRFGRGPRIAATVILLVYLIGYVGINFFTLGKALHALVGWDIFPAACLAAGATGLYVAVGGQTSVIMTDLLQGILLLVVGLGLFGVGIVHLGGLGELLSLLPAPHKLGFAPLREPSAFNTMGVFWQDAMAGGVAFYFINQGILMRFMSARSVKEGRKAVALVVLVVMPLAAVAVSGAGWIGRGMVATGELSPDTDPDNVFVLVSALLSTPGVFGLVMAMITAALMSTADTLLTAVSAVFVNDIWRPYLARRRDDKQDLAVARVTTLGTAALALVLVPLFNQFDSIYVAHATFVAAVVPPMAVALILGACWPRYGSRAALLTLVGGSLLVGASVVWPELITPFAQGMDPGGEGLKAHKYMRACYGLGVSLILAVGGAWWFNPREAPDPLLLAGREAAAQAAFKGAPFKPRSEAVGLTVVAVEEAPVTRPGHDEVAVRLHPDDQRALGAVPGDLLLVSAPGWWHGGLQSIHCRLDGQPAAGEGQVELPRAVLHPAGLKPAGRVLVTLEG